MIIIVILTGKGIPSNYKSRKNKQAKEKADEILQVECLIKWTFEVIVLK